jgi:menaquinone-dependent protoporphyrinogen oxidase
MQLFYATRDGQSRRIAERIAHGLGEQGIDAQPHDLAGGLPPAQVLAEARPMVVVVAAVRYGRHLAEAERFMALYSALQAPPPLVLLSVNLTARKPGKDTATGNVYLRKSIVRHRLKPVMAHAIAGRLEYPRYDWLDRQVIRFIMTLTGGPTDPSTCIEYTSWDKVDEIALRIAELCSTAGATRNAAPQ